MESFSVSISSLHERKLSNEKKENPSIIYFLCLFYTFLSMGLGAGLVGPSLLKFSEQLGESRQRTNAILFVRSLGFLGGTLIGGGLIDKFPSNGRTFLLIAVTLMGMSTGIFPFIYHLIPMATFHGVWAVSAGIVDNLAQILTIRSYDKKKVNPFLQALHGAFGVGAFLSPMIIGPLLNPSQPADQWHFAYWIIASLHIPMFFLLLFYVLRDEVLGKMTKEINSDEQQPMDSNKTENSPSEDRLTSEKAIVLAATTVFIFLYVGNESGFGSFLHSYATLHLKFDEDRAAYLSALFWGSFALTRMFSILLSMKFSALQMITFDLLLSLISLTSIFIWNRVEIVLWIFSSFFGIGAASVYAALIVYLEKHVSITGKRMSILAIGGSAGDGLIPLIIGYSMNLSSIGTIAFIVIALGTVILTCFLFLFIAFFVRRNLKKRLETESN